MKNNKSVLLLGSYGQTNLGDDLLMINYVDWLMREQGIENIVVNASIEGNIPKVVFDLAPGLIVKETYKTHVLDWLRVIRNSDAILYGGGTIYKELYGSTGRKKYAVIFRMFIFNMFAKLLKKKIYNLNVGIGSIKTKTGKYLTKGSLLLSDQTILRDDESYRYAKEVLKVPISKITLANDGIFISNKWQELGNDKRLKIPKGKKIVGINLLSDIPDWVDRKKYIDAMVDFINELAAQGYFIIFMPFQYGFNPNNDRVFIETEIIPRLKTTDDTHLMIDALTPENVSSTYNQLDYFVGMRFHSLLISIIKQVPMLAIEYDTKCTRLIKDIDYPYTINLSDIHADNLIQIFLKLTGKKSNASRLLASANTKLSDQDSKCLQYIDI